MMINSAACPRINEDSEQFGSNSYPHESVFVPNYGLPEVKQWLHDGIK